MTAARTTEATGASSRPSAPRRWRRRLAITGGVVGGLVLAAGAAGWYFAYTPAPEEPTLDATVEQRSITVDGMERTFTAVVPSSLADDAPLWVALHGSRMDGDGMRAATGYQLDELAVAHGFVVVYPDGYQDTWHDCRPDTGYPATDQGVDDVAFLEALVSEAASAYGLDTSHVYGVGYSNGSHMLFRMAAESPGTFAGIEANAANLPTEDNWFCESWTAPIPTILVEGTGDPINPFEGGQAGAFGQDLGTVMSAAESAAAIAEINGVSGEPAESVVGGEPGEAGAVTLTAYGADAEAPVLLYTVEGGGHGVPNPETRLPRMMGGGTDELNAPVAAWELFSRRG
ncbi:alpha/beta hydrolase family esterase [Demequina silvatica]|uniref:alpha/beta hydrolase family esterase n=1 Tax=Demequina silvatica TaxID=1638988 RepID=UPI000783C597|nr:PHB depolymerase family esterase [Demequina silvatica]